MSTSCFTGKRALVLGGTSGIGLATCQMLVDRGANVIGFGRSEDKVRAAVETVKTTTGGGTFDAKTVDVLDRDALESVFSSQAGFDYLVCTATGGGRAIGPFMEMDMDGFQMSFAKLWGYANAARFGVPHMSESGCVVLVSGSPAKKCKPGYVALSCVGAAVENLVLALAKEIAPRRCVGVSPGLIDTPMFDGKGDGKAAFLAKATASNPVPRAGTAEEVAAGIVFALENPFCTGTVIDVDGGAAVP